MSRPVSITPLYPISELQEINLNLDELPPEVRNKFIESFDKSVEIENKLYDKSRDKYETKLVIK